MAAARAGLPADVDVDELADVFPLLGEPGRLRTLTTGEASELCVAEVTATVGMDKSAGADDLPGDER